MFIMKPSLEARNEAIAALALPDLRFMNGWPYSRSRLSPFYAHTLQEVAVPADDGSIDLPRVETGGMPSFVFADPLDVALLQGNFGSGGNLEAIVRVRPRFGGDDYLVFYYFNSSTFRWNGPFDLVADGVVMDGVTGAPALIQGTWGATGNFELLVPMADRIAHFYRDNDAPGFPWHRNPDLPKVIGGGPGPVRVLADPIGVGFLQSNHNPGPGIPGLFEVVARMRPRLSSDDDYLATYTFDSASRRWTGPTELQVDGRTLSGVSGF